MRPVRQGSGLLGNWLALFSLHGMLGTGIDGNFLPGRFAHHTGEGSAFVRLSGDRCDSK